MYIEYIFYCNLRSICKMWPYFFTVKVCSTTAAICKFHLFFMYLLIFLQCTWTIFLDHYSHWSGLLDFHYVCDSHFPIQTAANPGQQKPTCTSVTRAVSHRDTYSLSKQKNTPVSWRWLQVSSICSQSTLHSL